MGTHDEKWLEVQEGKLNWESFFIQQNIEYVTAGPNTKRGEISIRCPWCGDEDPSHHLGVSLSRDVWGCHRNSAHRGKSPVRLVAALLGCSMNTAQLTLKQYTQNDPDDLEQALAMLTEEEKPVEEESYTVSFPPEFKPFTEKDRFGRYLINRGLNDVDIDYLVEQFGLRCASIGRYKDRVIFPLYLNNELVAWTARAITDPIKAPRYLASSKRAKMTLYGLERAQNGGDLLMIVEGPMDALAINTLPYPSVEQSVSAVALMGTSVTVPQLGLLRGLQKKFKQVRIMLDRNAFEPSVRLQEALRPGRVPCGALTNSWYKDPASMNRTHLRNLIEDALIPF